ncbi:GGDEF domain-containing protein [Mycolicibacterium sp. F2034L]|nr:GGDEF domain-containing protein [Mycolicibacterium sp. F2034L]MCK0174208.1 GGDEF domain-containing protein [Mycolicibacterium sp. F2034L]
MVRIAMRGDGTYSSMAWVGMTWLGRWWRQPDHFEWLSNYLKARGLADPVRRGMALVAASLFLVPLNALWGPQPLNRTIAVAVSAVVGLAGVALAVLWLTRWPTRIESVTFALVGSASIAFGCLWQAEPLIGLMSATALAVSGGYIAFFHTSRYMLVNFVVAVALGAWGAIRVAQDGELLLGLSGYFLVLELNVAVPFFIQSVVHSLGADLLRSDRDPLTGLLNRRAFSDAVVGRLVAGTHHDHLAVALIDLDRFKAINDTHGHAQGDAALVAVAKGLIDAASETALVCRMGGEEFLVADIVEEQNPVDWAKRLCTAVSSGPIEVTGSVGTATVPLHRIPAEDALTTFRRLIDQADSAMYTAKRRGGNQTHHAD